jgi:hypothetical protein
VPFTGHCSILGAGWLLCFVVRQSGECRALVAGIATKVTVTILDLPQFPASTLSGYCVSKNFALHAAMQGLETGLYERIVKFY